MEKTEEQEKIEQHIIYSRNIVESFKKSHRFESILKKIKKYRKNEDGFMEYKIQERTVKRDIENDRVIPLNTTIIHNEKNDENDVHATIHTGMSADEYTRSFHVLALTIGSDIFFRNGAYKPETEDGQKLLAHELTHVKQNENKPFVDNRTVEELEREAEKSEAQINNNQDPVIVKKIDGREYALKESQWRIVKKMAIEELDKMILGLENTMSGEKYLDLLLKYEDWTDYGENTWLI